MSLATGTPTEAKLFINGEFVDASDKATFELRSPYSGDLVGKSTIKWQTESRKERTLTWLAVSEATTQDVDRAVAAAKAAQPAWEALSPQQKGVPLAKLAQMIKANTKELAKLDALSLGRPISTYFDSYYATTQFQYFSEASYATGHSSLNTPGFLNFSIRQPYGVVAAIIPWNCPLIFLSKKLAPALAAGNTVVLKTSEKAPLSSHLVATMLNEAGFPPGVVNVLHGHGHVSGSAISSHMHIRALSFTGSVRTGRAIQKAAADSNFKRTWTISPPPTFPANQPQTSPSKWAANLPPSSSQTPISPEPRAKRKTVSSSTRARPASPTAGSTCTRMSRSSSSTRSNPPLQRANSGILSIRRRRPARRQIACKRTACVKLSPTQRKAGSRV